MPGFKKDSSINSLERKKVGKYTLQIGKIGRGRFSKEINFTLYLADHEKRISKEPVIVGKYFSGTGRIKAWMEVDYNPKLTFEIKGKQNIIELSRSAMDERLFQVLARLIPPGGHIMVKYINHRVTARALNYGVPPPATPLGYLLWNSGFRWFKDWYFSEGWMEGEQKLQGNKPVSREHKRRREKEAVLDLIDFLKTEPDKERKFDVTCRALALKILKSTVNNIPELEKEIKEVVEKRR